jgi:hypothetical protein
MANGGQCRSDIDRCTSLKEAQMGSMSIWHWIVVLLYIFVLVFPVARILSRLGMSRWWSALAIIPLLNLVGLWILAFVPWPNERST